MSIGLFIFLGAAALVLMWGVVVYNRFVTSRNRFQNAFSQIDVQLKRRYDLIPNLVNATRAYLTHERETLEAVVNARARAMQAEQAARENPADGGKLAAMDSAESALSGTLGKLFALSESYPALKADESVAALTEELTSTENRISFARQAFNDQVTSYNTAVESFPASIVAQVGGFRRSAQLAATSNDAERAPVMVNL